MNIYQKRWPFGGYPAGGRAGHQGCGIFGLYVNPAARWRFSQRTPQIRAAYTRYCIAAASKYAAMQAICQAGY